MSLSCVGWPTYIIMITENEWREKFLLRPERPCMTNKVKVLERGEAANTKGTGGKEWKLKKWKEVAGEPKGCHNPYDTVLPRTLCYVSYFIVEILRESTDLKLEFHPPLFELKSKNMVGGCAWKVLYSLFCGGRANFKRVEEGVGGLSGSQRSLLPHFRCSFFSLFLPASFEWQERQRRGLDFQTLQGRSRLEAKYLHRYREHIFFLSLWDFSNVLLKLCRKVSCFFTYIIRSPLFRICASCFQKA